MVKKWLIENFCPTDGYHCLMPVEYESVEQDGRIMEYRKKRIACRHTLAGDCEKTADCPFYNTAPDILEKNVNWYEP